MARLQFSYQQLRQELNALERIIQGFVDTKSARPLFGELRAQLDAGRVAEPGRPSPIRVCPTRPLRTIPSEQEYEPGKRRGKHRVVAEVSGTWELSPIGPNDRKNIQNRIFELSGNASILTRIVNLNAEGQKLVELARWRMEVGFDDSPGTHLHISVLGDKDSPPFPHSLSIPRFPALLITLGDATVFVLGEMFQSRWAEFAGRDSASMRQWRRFQKERLSRILNWKRGIVDKAIGDPWAALKGTKPPADLLLST